MSETSLLDRLIYDATNLALALLGPPTSVFIIGVVMLVHQKFLYLFFAIICIGNIGYYLYYEFFTDEAKNSTETALLKGDSGPTNDFYWMNIVISAIYLYISVEGFLHPHKVDVYRKKGAQYAQHTQHHLQRKH